MYALRLFGRASRRCALALGFGLLAVPAARAAIVLDTTPSNSFQTATVDVFSGSFQTDTQTHNPTGLPYTDTVTASKVNTTSTINTNLSQSLFNYVFTQATTDGFLSAEGQTRVQFTVTTDTLYALSGSYAMTSNANPQIDGPLSQFTVSLKDTNDTTLFNQSDLAFDPSDSYTLGTGTFSGSLTGTLLAGHTYVLSTDAGMAFGTDPTANGTGNVNLALGPSGPGIGGSPAPLPAGVWAGVITIAGVALIGRKRLAMGR